MPGPIKIVDPNTGELRDAPKYTKEQKIQGVLERLRNDLKYVYDRIGKVEATFARYPGKTYQELVERKEVGRVINNLQTFCRNLYKIDENWNQLLLRLFRNTTKDNPLTLKELNFVNDFKLKTAAAINYSARQLKVEDYQLVHLVKETKEFEEIIEKIELECNRRRKLATVDAQGKIVQRKDVKEGPYDDLYREVLAAVKTICTRLVRIHSNIQTLEKMVSSK